MADTPVTELLMRFLLVDRILELEPGVSIKAEKTLPAEEELFLDHFPGFPVVPGVLLTEMMGQTAAKCLKAIEGFGKNPMLIEIRNARFRSWVRPDEKVEMHSEITYLDERVAAARCRSEVQGRGVCSAELRFALVAASDFDSDIRDPVLESYLSSRSV